MASTSSVQPSPSKVEKIQNIFGRRGWTLSVAESCTGGRLSSKLTAASGASKYFLGGVVSYHASVKNKILKVPMSTIEVMGEVSEPVALLMAQGIRSELTSTWGIAVTGIAGPSGGTVDKPVGMVCFAVSRPEGSYSTTKYFGEGSRDQIQNLSVEYALDIILEGL